jgi:predicted 3-demethylubiquinone-9 3-methyltransferase (glyoxalase superfamily)
VNIMSKTHATPKTRAARAKTKVRSVTPFLWFEKDCERAAEFYVSLFQGSKIVSTNPMGCEFELAGQRVMALNGGPAYKLTPAFSLFVSVETQAQVDELWSRLTADGGQEQPCGWLVDKFGVSWQIIPERLMDLLAHKDARVAQAAVGAMMKMKKIEIAKLDAAVAALKPKARSRKVVA